MTLENEQLELLEFLEGEEIWSCQHEGCVGVHRGQLIMDGKVIDKRPTLKTLRALFHDLTKQEFG